MATFPKVLRDAGYKTKVVGKMHFTPTYADVGFDELAWPSKQDRDPIMMTIIDGYEMKAYLTRLI